MSIISFCLRSFVIVLLVFIVAEFRIKAPPQNLCRIYLIDDSASVFLDKDKLLASINENIKQLDRRDLTRILYLNTTDDKTVTNIEREILSAKGMFPSGYRKEIFLFSDGNQTEGDVRNVIPILKQESITLYTIPIGPNEVRDIRIDSVEAPKFVREGQPIELKCRISSAINTMAAVQVTGSNKLIRELKDIALLKNQDNSAAITLPAQSEPVQYYEIRVLSQGPNEITLENNAWKEVIQKTGMSKVLYVSSAGNQSQRIIPRLISSDFAVEVGGDEKASLLGLYDIIICDNISLASAPGGMEDFVSNGGGLLVVGGKDSFGLGNYQNSELEKILPVYATPPEDLSLVVILDASGSMDEPSGVAGKNKFQAASKALEESITLLGAKDRFEVMVFNQGHQTILPLQNAGNIASKLEAGIAKVRPTGPTAIIPPLQKAVSTLSGITSAKKHIILLSDGHSTTNEPLDGFKQMAGKLQQNNITISVIATGEHINEETMKAITKEGDIGNVYRLNSKDKDSLTRNLKEDLSVNKEFYREKKDLHISVLARDNIFKGIDNIPQISGYNRTTLKPDACMVAYVLGGEPLIADWQYGLGRVMVLATSIDLQWMGSWNKWDGLGQMITQSLRHLTSNILQDQLANIVIETPEDGRIKLSVEAPDNLKLITHIEPLYGEGAEAKSVQLSQVAVGRYEAMLPSLKDGTVISVFAQKEGSKQLLGRVPVVAQYAKEWRRFTPDMAFLKDIAWSTGGKFITSEEFAKGGVLTAAPDESDPIYRNINAILILAALGIFLTDLLIRR